MLQWTRCPEPNDLLLLIYRLAAQRPGTQRTVATVSQRLLSCTVCSTLFHSEQCASEEHFPRNTGWRTRQGRYGPEERDPTFLRITHGGAKETSKWNRRRSRRCTPCRMESMSKTSHGGIYLPLARPAWVSLSSFHDDVFKGKRNQFLSGSTSRCQLPQHRHRRPLNRAATRLRNSRDAADTVEARIPVNRLSR